MSKEEIKEILSNCKTIAVVGLSRGPEKDSYRVAAFMQKHGYRIVPVNPFVDEALGEKSYKSLLEIPTEIQKEIDVVDVFRRVEDVQPVVEQTVKLREKHGKPCVVWMQLGIVNEKAAATARKAGLTVIMDKCIMQEHKQLFKKRAKDNQLVNARRRNESFCNLIILMCLDVLSWRVLSVMLKGINQNQHSRKIG